MLIIPAIDLQNGNVVRLVQGKYEEITVYSNQPAAIAKKWAEEGASLLHLVDLDGALSGKLQNLEAVKNIVKEIKIPVELGGGIRNKVDIEKVLKIGVSRIVLGTTACEDIEQIKDWLNEFQEKIVISIDAKYGVVATEGWTKICQENALDLVKNLVNVGAKNLIYTDITRDGTLAGPKIKDIGGIINAAGGAKLIVSGGISSLEDLKQINALTPRPPEGVIIGKALYENKFTLKEAITLCLPKE